MKTEILQECKLQLEYLNEKFGKTGTTNALLAKIDLVLSEKPNIIKPNRRQMQGGTWVIHEGLQNNLAIKNRVIELSEGIKARANCDAHLSDIGFSFNMLSKELKEISDELFKLHSKEKLEGIENITS